MKGLVYPYLPLTPLSDTTLKYVLKYVYYYTVFWTLCKYVIFI